MKKAPFLIVALALILGAAPPSYADRVLVMHAGVDDVGVFGINNLINSLTASARFAVVDTWDADTPARDNQPNFPGRGLPTLADLRSYDVITMTTDNRSGIPIDPGYNITLLGNVLADYVDAGGNVIISTFGFSNNPGPPPVGGIGLKGRIMDDMSPFRPVQIGNGPAGAIDLPALDPGHPIMAGVGPWDSTFANVVDTRLGAAVILRYLNGEDLIAIMKMPNGNVVIGFNSFPGAQDDFNDPDYARTWANAVEFAQRQRVPAPGALILLGLGLAGLGGLAWRRHRQ